MTNITKYVEKIKGWYEEYLAGYQLIHEDVDGGTQIYIVYTTDGEIEIVRLFLNYFTGNVELNVDRKIEVDHTVMPLTDLMQIVETVVNTIKRDDYMPFFTDVVKELETLMPSYSVTWTGADYMMYKNILMADEKTSIMVVMREIGVFVYKWKDGEIYATKPVYENFPLDKDMFETETSWQPYSYCNVIKIQDLLSMTWTSYKHHVLSMPTHSTI